MESKLDLLAQGSQFIIQAFLVSLDHELELRGRLPLGLDVSAVTFGAVMDTLTEHVNEVVGAWVDPPGHDFFFVVDADDATQVFQGMFPIIDAGTAQVRPVGDFAAMLKARAEANA